MERIQKIIASSGYTSRRKAEELIKQGKVHVNGKKIDELGYKVSNNDIITINGEVINQNNKCFYYYLLNKPRGVISSTKDEKNRKTVVDLIDTKERIYPVGRLDYDTTGLIILTNDGNLSNILTHPSNKIEKTYLAKVTGLFKVSDLKVMEKGINIDGFKSSPCKVKIKSYDKKSNSSKVEITIHEGKNHQVKKMFNSLGYDVLKLKREKYAFLTLEGLKSGEYRNLAPKEVKILYSLAHKKKES